MAYCSSHAFERLQFPKLRLVVHLLKVAEQDRSIHHIPTGHVTVMTKFIRCHQDKSEHSQNDNFTH